MNDKILIAYTTNAGSSREVAEAIAGELEKHGAAADIRRLEEIEDLSPYKGVVVGGPMIMGWHRGAVKFLKKHQMALRTLPVVYFFTAMSLTRTGETQLNGVPVRVDPNLAKAPKNPSRLSYRERYATVERYLGPVLRSVPSVRPVSVGFFGGKLDFFKLKPLQRLFVMLVVQAQPGDRRNWPEIRDWAASLQPLLGTGA